MVPNRATHHKSNNGFKTVFEKIEHPAKIYLFKVNNRNTRKRCELYSELTTKTPEGNK